MNMNMTVEVLRIAVVTLGFVCFVWCLLKTSANWSSYDAAGKAFTMYITWSSFAMMWAASESLYLHSENGIRSVWFLVALINLLIGLWLTRGKSFFANAEARPIAPWHSPEKTKAK